MTHPAPEFLLIALHNQSRPLGMGWLQAIPGRMSLEMATLYIGPKKDKDSIFVDYVYGHPIKVDLKNPEAKLHLYERDNGKGSFKIAYEEAEILEEWFNEYGEIESYFEQ